MHEMALTRDVVDIVVEQAEAVGDREVRAVYLTIGYIRDIVEDLFERCFAHMARGTVAAHAELVITRIPLTVRCSKCSQVFSIDVHDENTWHCPLCKAPDYTLNSGMEFFIDSLDIAENTAPLSRNEQLHQNER